MAIGFLFLGDATSPLTILVTHDNVTKAVFANVVTSKGESHAYAERALAANITLLGHKRVRIQSDPEPAILDVKNKARQHTLTEHVADESLVSGEGEIVHRTTIHRESPEAKWNKDLARGI